jgi:homogentisate 1,2-dioxygenase
MGSAPPPPVFRSPHQHASATASTKSSWSRSRHNSKGSSFNADDFVHRAPCTSPADFHGPRERLVLDREEDTTVVIKDGARLTRYTLAQHPFDVVGWDGMVYPYTFNANDFEPITGTVHQPRRSSRVLATDDER